MAIFRREVPYFDREDLKEYVLKELEKLRYAILSDEVILLNTTTDFAYSDEERCTLSVNYVRKLKETSGQMDEYLVSALNYNPETNQWEIQGG